MIKDIQISVKDDIRFRSVRFMIYWTSTLEQLGAC